MFRKMPAKQYQSIFQSLEKSTNTINFVCPARSSPIVAQELPVDSMHGCHSWDLLMHKIGIMSPNTTNITITDHHTLIPVDHITLPKTLYYTTNSDKFNAEIVEFCRFLEPTKEEDDIREEALRRITDIVLGMFPSAQVKLFGSFATGQRFLCLSHLLGSPSQKLSHSQSTGISAC